MGDAKDTRFVFDAETSGLDSKLDNTGKKAEKMNEKLRDPSMANAIQKMNIGYMQASYAIGDMSAGIQNFRMGLMGVANNIPMIIQQFMAAKAEVDAINAKLEEGQKKATMGQVLIKSFSGMGGILISVNALMTALQVVIALMNSKSTGESQYSLEAYFKRAQDALEKLKGYTEDYMAKIGEAEVEGKKLQMLTDIFVELASVTNRTHKEQRELNGTINDLTKVYPEFGKAIDVANMSFSQQMDWITKIKANLGDYTEALIATARVASATSKLATALNLQSENQITHSRYFNEHRKDYEKDIAETMKGLPGYTWSQTEEYIRKMPDWLTYLPRTPKSIRNAKEFMNKNAEFSKIGTQNDKNVADAEALFNSIKPVLKESEYIGGGNLTGTEKKAKKDPRESYTYMTVFKDLLDSLDAGNYDLEAKVKETLAGIKNSKAILNKEVLKNYGTLTSHDAMAKLASGNAELREKGQTAIKDDVKDYLAGLKKQAEIDKRNTDLSIFLNADEKELQKKAIAERLAKNTSDTWAKFGIYIGDSKDGMLASQDAIIATNEVAITFMEHVKTFNERITSIFENVAGVNTGDKYADRQAKAKKAFESRNAEIAKMNPLDAIERLKIILAKAQNEKAYKTESDSIESDKQFDYAKQREELKAYLNVMDEYAQKIKIENELYDKLKKEINNRGDKDKNQQLLDLDKQHEANLEGLTDKAQILKGAFSSAFSATISAGMQSIYIFKEQNSLLEVFINSLGRAVVQLTAMKLAEGAVNAIFAGATGGATGTGFFSKIFGGIGSIFKGVFAQEHFLNNNLLDYGTVGGGSMNDLVRRMYNNPTFITQQPNVTVKLNGNMSVKGRELQYVIDTDNRHRSTYE